MLLALSVMPEEATTFGLQINCSETHIVQLTHLSIWGISDPTAGNGGVQDIQKYSLAIFVEFTESEYRSKKYGLETDSSMLSNWSTTRVE